MIPSVPKVLVVKLSAIGDVVHTLPAVNALRRFRPNAHITWLVEEAAANVVNNHPAVDRVLVSMRKRWVRGLRTARWKTDLDAIRAFLKTLRDTRYDMVIDFQAALKGAMLIALARAPRKIGFGPGMEHQERSYLVLNERIPMISMEVHALERGLALMHAIGVPYPQTVEYRLPIDQALEKRAADIIRENSAAISGGPMVAINPMAKWESKLWPSDRFAAVADRLVDSYEAEIFFTGSAADDAIIQSIIDRMHHRAANLAGKTTLMELAAVYKQMQAIISTDTGPMHIAAAVERPVVALFGPTAPWRTGPYGDRHHVLSAHMDCRPCYKRDCSHCRCMHAITVDDVVEGTDACLRG